MQHDLAAQVRLFDLQAQVALVLRHLRGSPCRRRSDRARRSAGGSPGSSATGRGRRRSRSTSPCLGRAQAEGRAVADRLHELVGDVDAVVQVQGLAVEVARRLADLEELLDLRVVHVQIDGRRTATQAALADRQRQGVHHADEGDDAAGLAGALDLLADRADAAPVGADAAAVGGQRRRSRSRRRWMPSRLSATEFRKQEIGRPRSAPPFDSTGVEGMNHSLRHIVIDALGVVGVVGIGRGDAGEHVLIALAGQQIAVLQRLLAEIGQQVVAAAIDLNLLDQVQLRLVAGQPGGITSRLTEGNLPCRFAHHDLKPVTKQRLHKRTARPEDATSCGHDAP